MRRYLSALILGVLLGALAFPHLDARAQVVTSSTASSTGGGGGGPATGVTPGTTTVTGCTSQVLIADASSKLNCDSDITFLTDTLTATKLSSGTITDSGLTAGRVVYTGTGGLLSAAAGFLFDGTTTTFAATNAPSFNGGATFAANTGPGFGSVGYVASYTALTPDAPVFLTTTTSNSWHIYELGDVAFDFQNCSAGTSAATDPLLCIHSHNQSTTQWIALSHNGTNGVLDVGTGIVTIPDGVTVNGASTFDQITLTTGSNLVIGTGSLGYIAARTATTPDTPQLSTSTTSNSWQITEVGDVGFDFNNGRAGTAAAGDPALIVRSRNQATNQYIQFSSQNATGAGEIQTNLADELIGASKSNITEGSAQAILRIALPDSSQYGMTVFYTITDSDGTDFIARTGSVKVQGVQKSGTATCTINTAQDQETEDGSQFAASGGAFTLTYTWTNAASTSNCDLSLNAASSAGTNTFDITYTAQITGTSASITATPQ